FTLGSLPGNALRGLQRLEQPARSGKLLQAWGPRRRVLRVPPPTVHLDHDFFVVLVVTAHDWQQSNRRTAARRTRFLRLGNSVSGVEKTIAPKWPRRRRTIRAWRGCAKCWDWWSRS